MFILISLTLIDQQGWQISILKNIMNYCFPALVNKNRFVIIKWFPDNFIIEFRLYEWQIMCSNKANDAHKHVPFIILILVFSRYQLFLFAIILHCFLWLHFEHIAYVEFHCNRNSEVKSFHVFQVVTKPVDIYHKYFWKWTYCKLSYHRLICSAFLLIRIRFDTIWWDCHWPRIVHFP